MKNDSYNQAILEITYYTMSKIDSPTSYNKGNELILRETDVLYQNVNIESFPVKSLQNMRGKMIHISR